MARALIPSDAVIVSPSCPGLEISKLDSRIANIRKDETHKFTSGYVKNHAVIVLGDLHSKGMSASAAGTAEQPGTKVKQKSGVNRVIPRQGRGELGWNTNKSGLAVLLTTSRKGTAASSAPLVTTLHR